MAHESRRKTNLTLQRLAEPFECGREVVVNGSCFYDSVQANAEDPRIRETLSPQAKGIFNYRDFRLALAHFMGSNQMLHVLPDFLRYRNVTLEDPVNNGQSWDEYLNKVAYSNDYADQLQIMCTALFCRKDILLFQVSEQSRKENAWSTFPGKPEGWPIPASYPPMRLGYLHSGEHFEPLRYKQLPAVIQCKQSPSESQSQPKCNIKGKASEVRTRSTQFTEAEPHDVPSRQSRIPAEQPSSIKTCKVCKWKGPQLLKQF